MHTSAHSPVLGLRQNAAQFTLLVAVGLGIRVGVDLEYLRPRPRALPLARRFFTAQEPPEAPA